MTNIIWIILVFLGIIVSFLTNNYQNLNKVILNSAMDAYTVFLKMGLMIIFWNGMFSILKNSGFLKKLSNILSKILKFVFPKIDKNSEVMEYISITLLSNFLGLGVASTSSGLKAFRLLSERNNNKDTPSKEMITFIVLNVCTISIFPTTIISIRNNFNAKGETSFLIMVFLSTFIHMFIALSINFIYNRYKK